LFDLARIVEYIIQCFNGLLKFAQKSNGFKIEGRREDDLGRSRSPSNHQFEAMQILTKF